MTGSGRGGGRGWRRDPPPATRPPQPRAAVQGGSSGAWSKMPAPPSAPPPPWAWRAGDDAEERGWPSPLIRSIPGAGLGAGATPRGSCCSHLVCSRRSGPVGAFTGREVIHHRRCCRPRLGRDTTGPRSEVWVLPRRGALSAGAPRAFHRPSPCPADTPPLPRPHPDPISVADPPPKSPCAEGGAASAL